MNITENKIREIEALAKLSLNDEERKQAGDDMNKMLDYIHVMEEMPPDKDEKPGLEEKRKNNFREDRVMEFENSRELLDGAIRKSNNCICVPNTF